MSLFSLVLLALIYSILIHSENDLNFKNQNYFISEDYVSRQQYSHYDDTNNTDEFQSDVYLNAYNLAKAKNLRTIGDIGCGSAYKLLKFFPTSEYEIIGFEIEPTLSFLTKKYPDNKWISSDLDFPPPNLKFDLLISSDVVEHLVNPDRLLNWIKKIDFKYLLISTPERIGLSQVMSFFKQEKEAIENLKGPPLNHAHMREWSYDEFGNYLKQFFLIENHYKECYEFENTYYVYAQFVIATRMPPSCECSTGYFQLARLLSNNTKKHQEDDYLSMILKNLDLAHYNNIVICSQNRYMITTVNGHEIELTNMISSWRQLVRDDETICAKIYL